MKIGVLGGGGLPTDSDRIASGALYPTGRRRDCDLGKRRVSCSVVPPNSLILSYLWIRIIISSCVWV